MATNDRFSRDQKTITVLCMIAYSALYFMRLNISLALTGIEESLNTTPEALGVVSSSFFWCYAFGQLIFGFLGDRLPVRFMVFTGLIGSAVMNLTVSFCDSVSMIAFFWALNGIFQSMLWSPMMKCVAKHFEGNKKVIATFALSITQVIGYILAWCVSYFIELNFGWAFVFRVPAVIGILFAVVWVIVFRYSSTGSAEKQRKKGSSLIRQPILLTFLGVLAVFSILFGLVKSSIDTWFPTMIEDLGGLSESGIVITLILVPLINFAGIMVSKSAVKRLKGDIYKCILLVWSICVAFSLISLVLFRFNAFTFVVIVALLFGVVYGMTPLFTSFIPLDFAKWDCVSTVTGFVDFAIYVGAGITGTVSGILLGAGPEKNWSALSIYWFIVLAVGLLVAGFVYFWHHRLRKRINREESEWD